MLGLFLIVVALIWVAGRDASPNLGEEKLADWESPSAASEIGERLANGSPESGTDSANSETQTKAENPDQIQEAADEPRFELAERIAKEKLVEGAEILDSVDTKIGLSNRLIRKTLFRTNFKYPLVLKREVIELTEEEEVVVKEEWMVGDHVLVELPNEEDENALAEWAAENGYQIRSRLRTAPIVMLSSSNPGVETVDRLQNSIGEFFQRIGADPLVQIAEPDYVYFPTATPNDPSYSNLWGLHNAGQSGGTNDADIDGPEAWDITSDASDVLVGVIDTGVDRAHPDLAANMWTNPLEIAGNGVDDDNNGFIDDVNGWDFFDNDNDPTDGGSHGTHCAGTIGAVGNNGIGVAGTAWNASLVGIRFLGPTGGTTSGAIESVNYATTLGVDLTSNSWGGGGFSTLLQSAIENGGSAGILFVAAAGNEGVNNDTNPHYPSSYASATVISVAASDHNDLKASFSNYGQVSVDLAAPGVSTYSTVPNSGYGYKSGTSMATPHVSGAVALIRSLAPHLTNAELKQLLIDSVDLVPAFSSNTVSGGRMNLHDAILEVGGPSLRLVEFTIDDGAPGNGDGFINPGEPVKIDLKIANQGTEAAENVTATLIREPGTVFSGDGSAISVGSIASGAQSDVADAFTITAAAGTATPYQEEISIRLEWGTSPRLTRDFTKTLTISTSSQVSGRVTAITGGAAISGAVISYNGPLSGTVVTDVNGDYQFTAIDGDYTLSAAAAGFAESASRLVTVPPDQTGIDFALGKPELDVDPTSVALTLFSGQSATRTLTLANDGDTPLDWTLSLAQANAQTNAVHTLPETLVAEGDPDDPDSQGVERTAAAVVVPMADLTGARIGLLVDWSYATFEADLAGRGAQVVNTLEFPLAAGDLDDFDVVMIDDAIARAVSGDVTIIRDFVSNGGSLVMMGDNSGSVTNMNAVLTGSGIQETYNGSFLTFTMTDIEDHATTEDVSSVYASQAGTFMTLTGDAEPLMRDPDGAIHAAVGELGVGKIIAVGNEVASSSNFSTGDGRLFANQIVDWLATSVVWLTPTPESGTLAPGASAQVTLNVDAANLNAGIYTSNVVISSNDPVSPQTTVPVTLTVNGAPALDVTPLTVAFDDTFLGQVTMKTVTLSNDGTDVLNVTGLTFSAPQFSTQTSAPLAIAAGEDLVVTLSFEPVVAGANSGTLTIASNAPGNGSVEVSLSGQGLTAPVIAGRVTALTGGTAIENATISYTGPSTGTTTTDVNGDYSIPVAAGTYSLTATAAGFSPQTQTVTVPPDRLDVNLALGAPVIGVNPASLTVNLAAGDQTSQIITLGNTGDVTLSWTSSLAEVGGAALAQLPESSVQFQDPDDESGEIQNLQIESLIAPLAQLDGINVGMISGNYTTIQSDMTARGATVTTGLTLPITAAQLDNYDVVMIDDRISGASTTDISAIRDWVADGGGLLLMADDPGSMTDVNAVLNGSGIQETSRTYFSSTMTDIPAHPITEGITSIYSVGAGSYLTLSGDALPLAREPDGKTQAGATTVGAGRIVAVGNEVTSPSNFSTGDGRQFANQIIDWLASASFGWVSIDPRSGSVAAGAQTDVTLAFDARNLAEGTYTAEWVIDSNDPTTPQTTVPLTLNITDAPAIVVEPLQLSFPDTFIGQSALLSVEIRNLGTEELSISALNSSHAQFAAQTASPITVAAGVSTTVNVAFAPNSVGALLATLTILNNDPTDASVTLNLSGTGLAVPSISGTVTALTGGAAVPNATVAYTGTASGSVTTDSNGDYLILAPAGTYTLSVSAPGFAAPSTQQVTIPPDKTDIDFVLGKPDIAADPTSVSLTLLAGDTASRTVTLSNDGDLALNWSLSVVEPAAQSLTTLAESHEASPDPDDPEGGNEERTIPETILPLSDLSGVRIARIGAIHSTFEGDLTGRGAEIVGLTLPLAAGSLNTYDVALIDDALASVTSNDVTLIRDFVSDGGGLFLTGDNSTTVTDLNAVLAGTGITQIARGFVTLTITNIAAHPTTADVSSVYSPSAGAYSQVSGDAVPLMYEADGKVHAAAGALGSGKIVVVGNEIYAASGIGTGDTRQFSNQVVDWLASVSATTNWLSVSPGGGTIAPSGNVDLTLDIDASNLAARIHTLEIQIDSNDPDLPQLIVPVNLQVDRAPNLVVSPLTDLVYPTTYTGQTASLPVTVSNTGTDDLTITTFGSSAPQFAPQVALPLFLTPSASQEIAVNFAPDAAALFTGTLNIVSDDPTDGAESLGLQGTGVAVAAMTLNPNAFNFSLPPGGSLNDVLQIGNAGGANLTWTAAVGVPINLNLIYEVDWDGPPHTVGQVTAIGGAYAPSARRGAPVVRQSAGGMTNRPLDLVGTPLGSFNYGGFEFSMGDRTDKVIVEFDLQILDSDDFTILFDSPSVRNFHFNDSTITFSGGSIPAVAYNSSVVNRIRIEYEIASLTASISVNGAAPVSGTITSGVTGLRSIRFNANDEGSAGGVLIDNLFVGTVSGPSAQAVTPANWISMTPTSGTVLPGQSQNANLSVDASNLPLGSYNAAIEIQSNDPANEDVVVPVALNVVAEPDIEVEQPVGVGLVSGSSAISFGDVAVPTSASRVFTIRNTGIAPLTNLTVAKAGLNPADFTPGLFGTTTLNPGESTTITVTFTPSAVGNRSCIFHINSNDPDEDPFLIPLSGQGYVPEIEVEQPADTGLVDGASSIDFETLPTGSILTKTFTIRSTGSGPLTGLQVTKSGPQSSDFSVGSLATSTLASGESTTFTVSFEPSTAGARAAEIQIASNDADENPFNISLTGLATGPEIVVEQPAGVVLTDGVSEIDFGSVHVGLPILRTFTIRNQGNENLDGLAVSFTGPAAADFSASSLVGSLAPGQSTTLDVTFIPSTFGQRNVILQIANNDHNENPFDILLRGTGFKPEIDVIWEHYPTFSTATPLVDGVSQIDLGEPIGLNSGRAVITIQNSGNSPLSGLSAAITGIDADKFRLRSLPPATLEPGGTSTHTIDFLYAKRGERTALIQIFSNDVDESPFDIDLYAVRRGRTTLESWARSFGLSGDKAHHSADDDGDGVRLLDEYAFNLDPTKADYHILEPGGNSGLPSIRIVNNRLQIESLRRLDIGEYYLPYFYYFGDSPEFRFSDPTTEPESESNIDLTWNRVIIIDSETVEDNPRRFATWRTGYYGNGLTHVE